MSEVGQFRLAKSVLLQTGFTCKIVYANMLMAPPMGSLYGLVCDDPPTAEFLFSPFVFGATPVQAQQIRRRLFDSKNPAAARRRYEDLLADLGALLRRCLPGASPEAVLSALTPVAEHAIRATVDCVLADEPTLVGISSMGADLCASLAIAKEVKRRQPSVSTIIGGPNCLGEMGCEILRSFPYCDYVAQGEAETSLPELVRNLRDGKGNAPPDGIVDRAKLKAVGPGRCRAAEVANLDLLPFPDFTDYFEQLPIARPNAGAEIRLPFETTRGCSWKESQGCSFCSFHHVSTVRRKSSPRILAELDAALSRYPASMLYCVDLILDKDRYRTVLPRLAAEPRMAALVLESTGSVPRRHVAQLSETRVSFFQPGIESVSPEALRLMNKPTTAVKNLQTLKWCGETGISCGWNYLSVIPGEDPGDVERSANFIARIYHLQPPIRGPHQIAIQRFSPYFEAPEKHGLGPLQVAGWVREIFNLPTESLRRLAYTFHSPQLDQQDSHPSYLLLERSIREWHRVWKTSFLMAVPSRGCLLVLDTRPNRRKFRHCLKDGDREVFEFCDTGRSLEEVEHLVAGTRSAGFAATILGRLEANRLIVHVDDRYLSLAFHFRRGSSFLRARADETVFDVRDIDSLGKLLQASALQIVRWKAHLLLLKILDVGIPRIKSLAVVTSLRAIAHLALLLAPPATKDAHPPTTAGAPAR